MQEEVVNIIFNKMMDTISSTICDSMDMQNIISKNITVGKKLFEHPTFLQTMRDNSYFKN